MRFDHTFRNGRWELELRWSQYNPIRGGTTTHHPGYTLVDFWVGTFVTVRVIRQLD